MSLFTISNIASKLLVFLLVPFYTNVLTESDYGIADVMQATLLLTIPLLSVNAGEAALRYGIEEKDKRGSILISGLKRVFISILLVFSGCLILISTVAPEEYRIYFALFAVLFACDSLYEFMLLYTQGCEKVEIMITGSVFSTAMTIAMNLLLLLVFHMGLKGYLFSQMAAFVSAALLMFFMMGGVRQLKEKEDQELKREMTEYGRGMMLYSTASWANNAIDRYFILFMLGTMQNGLYGVAYKIPAILMVFQRIFAQSFQMSATKSYKEKDSGEFFGKLYGLYNGVMLTGCCFILLILRPLAFFMFRKGFYGAWFMVPPLLISVIFGALEGYLGSICLAFKDGKSMGIATGAGALINIMLNYAGIMLFGAAGAACATLVSYFTMFAIAYALTGKHMKLEVDTKRDGLSYFLIMLAGFITMVPGVINKPESVSPSEGWWSYAAVFAVLTVLIFLYRRVLTDLASRFLRRA